MQNTQTNAEAGTAKVIRTLKSIERISRLPSCEIAVIDPVDLLKTINQIALRTIKESEVVK